MVRGHPIPYHERQGGHIEMASTGLIICGWDIQLLFPNSLRSFVLCDSPHGNWLKAYSPQNYSLITHQGNSMTHQAQRSETVSWLGLFRGSMGKALQEWGGPRSRCVSESSSRHAWWLQKLCACAADVTWSFSCTCFYFLISGAAVTQGCVHRCLSRRTGMPRPCLVEFV